MKKISKKKIIILVLTLAIYIPLVVFASISYSSSDVVVDTTTTRGPIYLQDAIDEIDYFCSNKCPVGMTCKNNTPKCIRATILHTETCQNSSSASYYCQGAGYALNDTITYGNTTTSTGVLTTGDAFDCDVNGDGVFDAETERFYYVSNYYDTNRKRFNDKVAVLVYYSNTTAGVASTSTVAYDCSNQNNNGPVTAMQDLPTTAQWTNIRLYKETRQILTRNDETATQNGNLPTSFSYVGYAARLLTYQELLHGCYDYGNQTFYDGIFGRCNFLFELTAYTNLSFGVKGSWLETSLTDSTSEVYALFSQTRVMNNQDSDITHIYGVRPTIEILKTEISY